MIPEPTGRPALDAFLLWATVGTLALSLGAGLWRLGRALARIGRKLNAFFEDWYGEPARPGVPARPGLMERVGGIEARMQGVQHELRQNSGQSLRDQVDRVNCQLARLMPEGDDHCRQRDDPDPPHPPPAAAT